MPKRSQVDITYKQWLTAFEAAFSGSTPAIKLVRTAAWNTKCVSNMRQAGLSIHTSTSDNEGTLLYQEFDHLWVYKSDQHMDASFKDDYQKFRGDAYHCPLADREIKPLTFWARFSRHFGMNSCIKAPRF